MADGRRLSARGARTRLRLLDAGLDLFAGLSAAQLFEALNARAVAAQAGVTTGAFYSHFENHAAYIDALIEYALSRQPDDDRIATAMYDRVIEYARAPDTHTLDDLLKVLEYNFQLRVEAERALDFVTAVWVCRRDRRVAALLRRRYQLVFGDQVVAEDLVWQRYNSRFRAPLTAENANALMQALLEGAVARHAVDPELISQSTYAHGVLAFLIGALEPGHVDSPPRLAAAAARAGIRDWEMQTVDDASCSVSGEVTQATIDLLKSHDLDLCSVEDIARRAGITAREVYATWGSRACLAAAVVRYLAEPLRAQANADLARPFSGIRVLERQIVRLGDLFTDLARARPVLLKSALHGSIDRLGGLPPGESNLGVVLLPALDAGRRDGSVTGDIDPLATAHVIASSLASLALEHPGTSSHAHAIVRVLTRGLMTQSRRAAAD